MLLQIIYFSCVPYNNVMKKYSKGLGKKEEKDKFKAIRHAIELISLPPPLLSVYCLVFCNIKYLVIEYIQTVDYSNICIFWAMVNTFTSSLIHIPRAFEIKP